MTKARILIVEDEAIIAMELESQLQSLGYEVTSIVDTGQKAIEKAEKDKPDLMLMDIRIKGEMDGIDTAEVIRNRFGIPVIFSTAYLDKERIERAKITMPFGYVLKPIQERDLKVTIEMALYVAEVDADRRKIEENLKENAFFLNKAQEIGQLGHFSYDPVSGIVEGSKELFRIFDVDPSKPLFEAFASSIHPDDGHLIFPFIDRTVKEGISYDVEHRVCHQNGDVLHVNAKGEILITSKGKRMVGIVQDITERKQVEYLLLETQRMAKLGSWEYDIRTNKITWSKEVYFLFGLDESYVPSLEGLADWIHPDDLWVISPETIEKNTKAGIQEMEYRIIDQTTKEVKWVIGRGETIKDSDGNSIKNYGSFQDITNRKQIENELRASKTQTEKERNLLQEVMNSTKNVHLVYLDNDFNFVRVNKAYAETCGYEPEEMVGKNHFDLYPHEENEVIFAKVRDTGELFEIKDKPFSFPDQPERGTTYWDWSLVPIKGSDGRVVGLVFSLVETTGRKLTEEALQESEEKYRRLFEDSIDGIALGDPETGIITLCNQVLADMVGRTKEELIGQHQRILHPSSEQKGDFSTTFKQHVDDKSGEALKAQLISKTGETKTAIIRARVFELNNKKIIHAVFRLDE
jgi:PAS domain S-box-containing protein